MATPDPALRIDLSGRAALVTGAARGIGARIACRLREAGARVWITDKDAEAAAALARSLDAPWLRLDVRRREDAEHAVARVAEASEPLAILVNNAGTLTAGPFDATPEARWREMLDVNLHGLFTMVRAAAPSMPPGAAILNVASVSAQRGGGAVGNVWYGATKAGVIAATQGLARELGPRGVRVNAIAPGVVETGLTAALLTEPVRRAVLPRFPLGRIAEADDVACAAAFLCSPLAAFISGAVLAVDGGFLCT